MKKSFSILLVLFLSAALLAACGGKKENNESSPSASGSPKASAAAAASKKVDKDLANMTWDEVLAEAKGQTINFYHWGGDNTINQSIDERYGKELKEKYDITLNRVPVTDTVEAVNKVMAEKTAGKTDDGSVDMIWINGLNFVTMKQGSLLFGPWAKSLPNSKYVNYDNPAVTNDFGEPTEGFESPWGGAQFQFVYDADRMKAEELPKSYAQLKDWVKAHPGRFTYVATPEFHGHRFLNQLLIELTGKEKWGPYDQAAFQPDADKVSAYLKEIRPNLWRKGKTFPKSIAELDQLFANNEVDFTFTQRPSGVSSYVKDGSYPKNAKPFLFDTGTIGDFHYLAIPFNSPNKAAALVLADLVLRPDLQAAKMQDWGDGLAIDTNLLSDAEKKPITDLFGTYTDMALSQDALAKVRKGDLPPSYQKPMDELFMNSLK